MSDALQEAVDAAARALWARDGWVSDDYPEKALNHRVAAATALGAIPDDVLVRYAVERGALIETYKRHWVGPQGAPTNEQYAPLYAAKQSD
jgi:hypothetical protein